MSTSVLKTEFDTVGDVMGLRLGHLLIEFSEMWYHVFLWALFSSAIVWTKMDENNAHTIAAFFAFITLRKHKFGRFFSILILVMGVVSPVTSGFLSSATIAFVHRMSSLQMSPVYAMVWGVGQTVLSASICFTRILATL